MTHGVECPMPGNEKKMKREQRTELSRHGMDMYLELKGCTHFFKNTLTITLLGTPVHLLIQEVIQSANHETPGWGKV